MRRWRNACRAAAGIPSPHPSFEAFAIVALHELLPTSSAADAHVGRGGGVLHSLRAALLRVADSLLDDKSARATGCPGSGASYALWVRGTHFILHVMKRQEWSALDLRCIVTASTWWPTAVAQLGSACHAALTVHSLLQPPGTAAIAVTTYP